MLDWRKESALYLMTGWIEDISPVHAGRTGRRIPPYLLPLSDRELEGLCGWASYYRAHDLIWIGNADLEIPAYRQLADPRSHLSRSGLTVRQSIERATGLPTYYYLYRYHGHRDHSLERNRKCPGCGRRWRRQRKAAAWRGLAGFDFRCDHGRLISDTAPDDSNERHARIGEWRPRGKKNGPSAGCSEPHHEGSEERKHEKDHRVIPLLCRSHLTEREDHRDVSGLLVMRVPVEQPWLPSRSPRSEVSSTMKSLA